MSRASNPDRRPRRTADDWVAAGLRVLTTGSINDVKVERLAADLGVTKGSFYWHYTDRAALLNALRDRWVELDTEAIIDSVDQADPPDPRAALNHLFAMIFDPAADQRIEAAIREWSATDPDVARVCRRIDERRLAYVADQLTAAGLPPALARGRAEVLYRVVIGEATWRRYGGKPIDPSAVTEVVERLSQP